MYTVLICDDDEDIRRALEIYLTGGGYRVLSAGNGWETLKLLEAETVHLILLDIMMPVLDGAEVLTLLREKNNNVPVIFLTAKGEDDDKIAGLELGADDYITKPFNILELKARIRALLRRTSPQAGASASAGRITRGPITIDTERRSAEVNGKSVELTVKEFDLVELLMRTPGKVYSRENLLDLVWGYEYQGDIRTVDVHIRRLREKLEENPAKPECIITKWGVGYYFKEEK